MEQAERELNRLELEKKLQKEEVEREEAERELTESESTEARKRILAEVKKLSKEQHDSRGMRAFYEKWLKPEKQLAEEHEQELEIYRREAERELTEIESTTARCHIRDTMNLIKELARLCSPWREGAPPGYLRSSLPLLDPKNEELQKQLGVHELKDKTLVFWRKPGGRFSWSGSKDWISALTWTDVEEYGIKSTQMGTQLVVLTLETKEVSIIEDLAAAAKPAATVAAAAEPAAKPATSHAPSALAVAVATAATAPTAAAAAAARLTAVTSSLQERLAVITNVEESLVTISVARGVESTIFTAEIAMTGSTAAEMETLLASNLNGIPIAQVAAQLALPGLTIVSTAMSDHKPPSWMEKAKKANEAEKAEEEAMMAKEAKKPKEAKADKEVKNPTFRMCTASEVQEVLKATSKRMTLYPLLA
eukprot:scaffold20293_cov53-Phaeocystis_antarctica.AAC.2